MQSDGAVYRGVIEIGSKGVCHRIPKQNRALLLAGRRLRLRKMETGAVEKGPDLFCFFPLSLLFSEFSCFLCGFLLFLGGLCTLLQLIFARLVRFRLQRFVIPRKISEVVPQKFSSLTWGPLRTWLLVCKIVCPSVPLRLILSPGQSDRIGLDRRHAVLTAPPMSPIREKFNTSTHSRFYFFFLGLYALESCSIPTFF